jgi:LemA protein
MIAIFIIIGVVVLLAIYFIVLYNRLVRMRNDMSNAWAQIEVQLKRRHDLIPNLVETVKGYAAHERETLDAVTNARNMAQSAVGKGAGAQSKAEGLLGGALSRLLAVAENYPDLKANQNFLSLQGELSSTENKIASSRMDYNDMVLHCNNTIQTVPSNIVAGLTGFKPGEFFELETPEEKDTPSISFT